LDFVVRIKGSPYSAGGSSDFWWAVVAME
jgi:hypothetical protein